MNKKNIYNEKNKKIKTRRTFYIHEIVIIEKSVNQKQDNFMKIIQTGYKSKYKISTGVFWKR